MPVGWTHVSEDLGSHFLSDGEAGATREDFVATFYRFVEGFKFWTCWFFRSSELGVPLKIIILFTFGIYCVYLYFCLYIYIYIYLC